MQGENGGGRGPCQDLTQVYCLYMCNVQLKANKAPLSECYDLIEEQWIQKVFQTK